MIEPEFDENGNYVPKQFSQEQLHHAKQMLGKFLQVFHAETVIRLDGSVHHDVAMSPNWWIGEHNKGSVLDRRFDARFDVERVDNCWREIA